MRLRRRASIVAKALHMEPDDIKVQDTAVLVWEIR